MSTAKWTLLEGKQAAPSENIVGKMLIFSGGAMCWPLIWIPKGKPISSFVSQYSIMDDTGEDRGKLEGSVVYSFKLFL